MKAGWKMLGLAATAAAAACAPKKAEPPPPPPPPPPVVTRPPPPPPAVDWPDRPTTPGDWIYSRSGQGSQAVYGPPASEAAFIMRCEPARRQVTLEREGVGTAARLRIRTTTLDRTLAATARREPLAYTSATLPANDPLLDAMVFSRGRFAVETDGLPMLVLPTWAEPARVVEDCRG